MTTKVEKSITVDVPISTAYNQWTQFEDFPQFMGGVQQVEQLDDHRLRWVAEIGGVRREWYATILEQRADEKIAWAATEGATNAGAVYFSEGGAGQTVVRLELEYEPEGLVEKVGDKLNIVERQAESDLEKFKSFIESRSTETGAWRGDVEGDTFGTPGVETAATTRGDSGKAGVSGKVAAAGVAAVAGVAAAVAARSGSGNDTDNQPEATAVVPVAPAATETPVVEETTYTAPEVTDASTAGDSYGVEPGVGDEDLPGGVELDSSTPGISEGDEGGAQRGIL